MAPTNVATSRAVFLVSVLILFVELMLIRWISTEIRIFAYLQNTVLVVCFLGLGMGCFSCRRPIRLTSSLLALFSLVGLLAFGPTRRLLGGISEKLSVLTDLVVWYQSESSGWVETTMRLAQGLGLTFVVMALLWMVFLPLGRMLGRLMADHPRPLTAYSLNIAGSLAGVWLFAGMSAWYLGPFAWFCIAAGLFLCFVDGERFHKRVEVALLAAIVALSWPASHDASTVEVLWSPYQKLAVTPSPFDAPGTYAINVNNVGYQTMLDLRGLKPEQFCQYDLPFMLHRNPRSVLLVGAGSGNDAAGALRRGVERITAVEIDPGILSLGRRYHPEAPYSSPKVTVVIDDARSFFSNSKERFDVIVFGLLDSHTTTSLTNARLDHFVYTRESIELAKSLLAEGGVMVQAFQANRDYIADRMARTIESVFGSPPLVFRVPFSATGWGGVFFVAGDMQAVRSQLDGNPPLANLIAGFQKDSPVLLPGTTEVATDDWPYIYLESRTIPVLYFLLAGLLTVLFGAVWLRVRGDVAAERWGRSHWHFFFLGAAFLLLEVQNISKACVVLGNTWFVNVVIITGLLLMALFANAIVLRFPRLPVGAAGTLLCATCLGLYFVDLSMFSTLPGALRVPVVGAITCLPMLFSGFVFSRSFAASPDKAGALGANLMGALVGGLLQSVTFVTGIRALLLIVAGLYFAALLVRPRASPSVDTAQLVGRTSRVPG